MNDLKDENEKLWALYIKVDTIFQGGDMLAGLTALRNGIKRLGKSQESPPSPAQGLNLEAIEALAECIKFTADMKGEGHNLVRRCHAALEEICRLRKEPKGERLEWTREKPTEPGWYWYNGTDFPGRLAIIQEGNPMMVIPMLFDSAIRPVHHTTGEWAGPIPEPSRGNNAAT